VLGFVVRRIGQAVIVIAGVSLIVFVVSHMLPGGPARAVLGIQATPQAVRQFMVENGYNRPLWLQFVLYWDHILHGNFGFSYQQDLPVSTLLKQDLLKTGLLVGLAFVAAFIVGIPVGLWQATKRDHVVDHFFTSVFFVGYSMPVFWVGLLLIVVFSVNNRIFPAEAPQGVSVGAILSDPRGLVLPVLTLMIVVISPINRFMRSAAIETLAEDYIRTATAKGASRWATVFRHVLRNSILPVISLIGLSLPAILSGSLIVETVFNYPGMGLLFWTSAVSRDYPVLLGATLILSFATVLGSLLADLLYAIVDPRVKY